MNKLKTYLMERGGGYELQMRCGFSGLSACLIFVGTLSVGWKSVFRDVIYLMGLLCLSFPLLCSSPEAWKMSSDSL